MYTNMLVCILFSGLTLSLSNTFLKEFTRIHLFFFTWKEWWCWWSFFLFTLWSGPLVSITYSSIHSVFLILCPQFWSILECPIYVIYYICWRSFHSFVLAKASYSQHSRLHSTDEFLITLPYSLLHDLLLIFSRSLGR